MSKGCNSGQIRNINDSDFEHPAHVCLLTDGVNREQQVLVIQEICGDNKGNK
jgi:hypothetical protein